MRYRPDIGNPEIYRSFDGKITRNRRLTVWPTNVYIGKSILWTQATHMVIFQRCFLLPRSSPGYGRILLLSGSRLRQRSKSFNINYIRVIWKRPPGLKQCTICKWHYNTHFYCKDERPILNRLTVAWHHSLLLMNSFNKTEAAVFSCRLCFLRAFPFISLMIPRWSPTKII